MAIQGWPRGGSWRGISMEPGGKGSFQAVKLQRPPRAAVCSHSPEGHSRQGSIQSQEHLKKCSVERLSRCGQSGGGKSYGHLL